MAGIASVVRNEPLDAVPCSLIAVREIVLVRIFALERASLIRTADCTAPSAPRTTSSKSRSHPRDANAVERCCRINPFK